MTNESEILKEVSNVVYSLTPEYWRDQYGKRILQDLKKREPSYGWKLKTLDKDDYVFICNANVGVRVRKESYWRIFLTKER